MHSLLRADEPRPIIVENIGGNSPIVLVCEHGGRYLPARLDSLGLDKRQLDKHFMWDIGALALSRAVANYLDSPLVHQPYSRMICDCNRRPEAKDFIPEQAE